MWPQPMSPERGENPYVGPRAFEDGETLFGRDRELTQLLDRILPARIVLMYSLSGAGKTSLVQAGLLPRLREHGFTTRPTIRVGLPAEPGVIRNRFLHNTFTCLQEDLPPDGQREALSQVRLCDYLDSRRTDDDEPEILVFDQFEELLNDPTESRAQEEFMTEVGEALRNRRRWALFIMREDRLALLDPYLRLVPTRFDMRYRLGLLSKEAAHRAIQGPAAQRGSSYPDDVAESIISNLAQVQVQTPRGITKREGSYIEPVQLQVVCRRLWQKYGFDNIDQFKIRRLGDVDRALGDYYEETIQSVVSETEISEKALRDWFSTQLITKRGFREQAPHGPDEAHPEIEEHAIAVLEKAHLIRREPQRGATWYELTHDRLVAPVQTRNETWRAANTHDVERQALLWQANSQRDAYLLRGVQLENALQEIGPIEGLDEVAQSFVNASISRNKHDTMEARLTRILKVSVRVLIVLLAIVTVLAVAAVVLWRDGARQRAKIEAQQRVATSRSLRGQAETLRDERPIEALRLGLVAAALDPGVQTNASLTATLAATHYAGQFSGYNRPVNQLAYGKDGRLLITAGDDINAMAWDVTDHANPKRMTILKHHTRAVVAVAISADGGLLALGSVDGTVSFWRVGDRLMPEFASSQQVIDPAGSEIVGLSFGPDRLLAVAKGDSVTLLDASDPQRSLVLGSPDGAIGPAVFSPDGKTLVAGGYTADTAVEELVVWDTTSPAKPKRLTGIAGVSKGAGVSFTQDGKTLASVGREVVLVDMSDRTRPRVLSTVTRSASGRNTAAFNPKGDVLAVGNANQAIDLFNIVDPSRPRRTASLTGHSGAITSVAFNPAENTLASTGTDYATILWDVIGHADPMPASYRAIPAMTAVFSPDGRFMATQSNRDVEHDTNDVTLWRVGGMLEPLKLGTFQVRARSLPRQLSFSADGSLLSILVSENVGTSGLAGSLLFWDVSDPLRPRRAGRIDGLRSPYLSSEVHAFSPVGRIMAVSRPESIVLVDLKDPEHPADIKSVGANQVPAMISFSRDGKTLSASRPSGVELWDVSNPEEPRSLSTIVIPDVLHPAAFSPDGRRLVIDSEAARTQLWNIENPAKPARVATIPPGYVLPQSGAAFSRDGKVLVLQGFETLALWNFADEQSPSILASLPVGIPSLDEFGDTMQIVTLYGLAYDGFTVWDLGRTNEAIRSPVDLACKVLGGGISLEDWRRYAHQIEFVKTCPS